MAPAVVAEDKLVQVASQMFFIDSVVGATQPGFQVANDTVNPGKNFTGHGRGFLDLAVVDISLDFNPTKFDSAIGVELRAGDNILGDERVGAPKIFASRWPLNVCGQAPFTQQSFRSYVAWCAEAETRSARVCRRFRGCEKGVLRGGR